MKKPFATLVAAMVAIPAIGASLTPKEFIAEASAGGQAEVELGKLALQKSQSPDVRAFAQKMVDDHGKANAELATIAKAKGLKTSGPNDEQRALMEELRRKDGKDFDAAYAAAMSKDHDQDVSMFSAAGTLQDAQLAGFARKTLPVLTQHQQMAHQLDGAH
jgi:putative membrane protein